MTLNTNNPYLRYLILSQVDYKKPVADWFAREGIYHVKPFAIQNPKMTSGRNSPSKTRCHLKHL